MNWHIQLESPDHQISKQIFLKKINFEESGNE